MGINQVLISLRYRFFIRFDCDTVESHSAPDHSDTPFEARYIGVAPPPDKDDPARRVIHSDRSMVWGYHPPLAKPRWMAMRIYALKRHGFHCES